MQAQQAEEQDQPRAQQQKTHEQTVFKFVREVGRAAQLQQHAVCYGLGVRQFRYGGGKLRQRGAGLRLRWLRGQ